MVSYATSIVIRAVMAGPDLPVRPATAWTALMTWPG